MPDATASAPPRRVVGLGASAGGLAPLIEFFSACPRGAGLSFVVVQHLGAAQASMLAALLQPHTTLTVVEACDGLPLAPDQVAVIQPGTRLSVAQGRLRVQPLPPHPQPAHPIDHLFLSLAREFGAQAVGVVLSGMGSDGGQGLRAMADAGGLALVQHPGGAQFDAMPRSAAAMVGAAAQMARPAAMPALITGQPVPLPPPADGTPPGDDAVVDDLAAIVRCVTRVTGQDFALYQPSTLRRRIERRLALHGLATLAEYRRLISDSAPEAQLLFKELLIGVTAFFRDPAVWEALGAQLDTVIHTALQRPEPQLRAWVVGCSTGEEAYTLAMLCHEALERVAPPAKPVKLQIFATDLNADAIEFARRGVYPEDALSALSPSRWLRFFVRDDGGYRVSKTLRESVLFARHDVIHDAPFSRLDIVSCRNLLIYFQPVLQQRVLALFQYVLQPGGLLVLGNSESLGRQDAAFEPVDAKLRLHRRLGAATLLPALGFPARPMPLPIPSPREPSVTEPRPAPGQTLQSLADRLMLDEFAPPAVLVDEHGDILYVSGRTGRFLEPAAGKANWNVHVMAREGLRGSLTASLRRTVQEGRPVDCHGLHAEVAGLPLIVDLALRPVKLPGYGPLALVIFREMPLPPPARSPRGEHDAELARALAETQALREEMRSSQEELQSTNEELQSTNEELQSANEELTTSKEEMQAMNEELQTVNAELLSKIEDLAQAQSDLKNLLNSTQIATLFLDGRLNVRRFTEQAKRLINLRDSDIGRPLSDLTTSLEYPQLAQDVAEVLRTLEFREHAARSLDGRWYSVRIMPYRTQDNVIDGSVITFIDITAAKLLEEGRRGDAVPPQPPA